MPFLSSRAPMSLGQSIGLLLSSTPQVKAKDLIAMDVADARMEQSSALAAKARAEIEKMRSERAAADRDYAYRTDPANQSRYAGMAAGMTEPEAADYERYRTGATIPGQITHDDQGSPLPPGNYDEGKWRGYTSALSSTIANLLSTGKTNPNEIAQAGGRNFQTQTEAAAQRPGISIPDANALNASIGRTVRNPYQLSNNATTLLNKETGVVGDVQTETAKGERALTGARTGQAAASAGLSNARAQMVGVPRNPAQTLKIVDEIAAQRDDAFVAGKLAGLKDKAREEKKNELKAGREQRLQVERTRVRDELSGGTVQQNLAAANKALAKGIPFAKVSALFKQKTGHDLNMFVHQDETGGAQAGEE